MPEKTSAISPRISDLARKLQREPGSRVFFELAREHHQSGNLEDAARLCREGLQKHPAYHSARVLLARVLIDMKQFSSAKPELERVMKQAPGNLLARRLLAEALAAENDREGAREILRGLLILNPADEEAEQRLQELSAPTESKAAGLETLPGETASHDLPPAEEVSDAAEPDSERTASGFQYQAPFETPTVAMAPPAPPEEAPPPPPPASAIATVMMRRAELPGVVESPEPAASAFGATAVGESRGSSGTATVIMRPGDLPKAPEEQPVPARSSEGAGGRNPAAGSSAATVMMRPDQLPATMGDPRVEPPAPAMQAGEEVLRGGTVVDSAVTRDELNEPTMGALPTPTLAEIYLTQGMPERALQIYKQVLVGDPHNQEALARVREISGRSVQAADLTHHKIQVLEGWLERIRRHHHVQDDAGRGGPKTAGM